MRLMFSVATAMFAFAAPAAAQTTLDADLTGTITTSILNPIPGVQRFTLSGGFTSYSASADLPQITGNDLDRYSFSVSGVSESFDALTRTTIYRDVTGTINGYGQVVQELAPTRLRVVFNETFTSAQIFGTLLSAGPSSPQGFPGPVDFTPANGASITGTYTSTGPQNGTFVGSIDFPAITGPVPEPAAWGLMILGVGAVGGALRQRRRANVRFA